MTQFTEVRLLQAHVVDRDGEKIGKVDEVYSCQEGGRPEWALVHTGLLGSPAAITPTATASCPGGPGSRADPLRVNSANVDDHGTAARCRRAIVGDRRPTP